MASELQVNTITEATSGSGITFAKDIIPATPLSHRNMVINGAMLVHQRGGTVNFADSSTILSGWSTNFSVSYLWDFRDGFTSTQKNPCHTFGA